MNNFTIKDYIEGYKSKKFSVEEVTKQYLGRISELNPKYNAYINVTQDFALEQARSLDEQGFDETLSLWGIPMGLKDIFSTKNIETTAGSEMLKGYFPPFNAPVVDNLYAKGSVLLGKLNTDEFACGGTSETSVFGATLNPYDTSCVAGGSSAGSAAAIPLDLAVFTTGSDTGGSIRQPAAFCNAVGLKVTYGRVPRSGIVSMASSWDTIGHFTKTVADSALVLEATAQNHKLDSTTGREEVVAYSEFVDKGVEGMRIGIPKEYFDIEMEAGVREAVMIAVKELEKQGAVVKEVSLPYSKYAVAVYSVVMACELSANMARYDGIRFGIDLAKKGTEVNGIEEQYLKSRQLGLGEEVKKRIIFGSYALSEKSYEEFYLRAQKVRTLIVQDFENVFKEVDVLCTPTAPVTAFKLKGTSGMDKVVGSHDADAFTIPANCAGIPGLSVPCGVAKNGMPVGLQILAPKFREDLLFQVGGAYEKVTEFYKKAPEV